MDILDALWYGAVTPEEALEKPDRKQQEQRAKRKLAPVPCVGGRYVPRLILYQVPSITFKPTVTNTTPTATNPPKAQLTCDSVNIIVKAINMGYFTHL